MFRWVTSEKKCGPERLKPMELDHINALRISNLLRIGRQQYIIFFNQLIKTLYFVQEVNLYFRCTQHFSDETCLICKLKQLQNYSLAVFSWYGIKKTDRQSKILIIIDSSSFPYFYSLPRLISWKYFQWLWIIFKNFPLRFIIHIDRLLEWFNKTHLFSLITCYLIYHIKINLLGYIGPLTELLTPLYI